MTPSRLCRALDHCEQAPGLATRQRPARSDRDGVALLGLVVFVVRQQLGGATDELAVGRMTHHALDLDRDGLVHLVADDLARERTDGLALARGIGAHDLPPVRLALCTVLTRAMFLR